jgi:hypothetical protein
MMFARGRNYWKASRRAGIVAWRRENLEVRRGDLWDVGRHAFASSILALDV